VAVRQHEGAAKSALYFVGTSLPVTSEDAELCAHHMACEQGSIVHGLLRQACVPTIR
jgi:hypothetical protein